MENNENKKIYLSKQMIGNLELSDEAVLAYVALRLSCGNKCKQFITYQTLCFELTENINDKGLIAMLKKGITDLEVAGFISSDSKTTSKIGKKLSLENLFLVTDNSKSNFQYFITVEYNEVYTILNSHYKFRLKLLRYFICMIGTINHANSADVGMAVSTKNVGSQSISTLADMTNISKTAVMNYNKWLEENNLIYIRRCTKLHFSNSNSSQGIACGFTNCYGRPKDRDSVNALQTYKEESFNNAKTLCDDVNLKRSMTQKYHKIKQGHNYSADKIEEVYYYCRQSNIERQQCLDRLQNMINNNHITEFDAKRQKEQIESKIEYDLDFLQKALQKSQKEGAG